VALLEPPDHLDSLAIVQPGNQWGVTKQRGLAREGSAALDSNFPSFVHGCGRRNRHRPLRHTALGNGRESP
jgi:hypothetical protein